MFNELKGKKSTGNLASKSHCLLRCPTPFFLYKRKLEDLDLRVKSYRIQGGLTSAKRQRQPRGLGSSSKMGHPLP